MWHYIIMTTDTVINVTWGKKKGCFHLTSKLLGTLTVYGLKNLHSLGAPRTDSLE